MKYQFNRSMLPIIGVKWVPFDTEAECDAFMDWAEKETEHDQYPCDAYWVGLEIWDGKPQYVAKVKNW